MYDIVALGELLVDFTQAGVSENGMRLFEQNPGGAVTNALAAASRLGRKTAFIGKVGNDMHGAFLKKAMEDSGVDMRALVVDDTVFTTLAFVSLTDGERAFSFARKPGADTCLRADEVDSAMLAETRVFHIGSLSVTDEPARTATFESIKAAKAAGALISYDPNYRASLWRSEAAAREGMRSILPYVDLMKLSDEETELLTDRAAPEDALRALNGMGVRCACVTLGKDGALVGVGGRTTHVPAFPVAKIVDTTGAGDAFMGGFLAAFLQDGGALNGITIEKAAGYARVGCATASLCTQKRGGISGMPAREAVELLLHSGDR